jgi:hypothetical protein
MLSMINGSAQRSIGLTGEFARELGLPDGSSSSTGAEGLARSYAQ